MEYNDGPRIAAGYEGNARERLLHCEGREQRVGVQRAFDTMKSSAGRTGSESVGSLAGRVWGCSPIFISTILKKFD